MDHVFLYFVGVLAAAYATVIFGWIWKTEWRKCRRCRLRVMDCPCLEGPR